MIIGLFAGGIAGWLLKSVFWGIVVFYFATGIRKSLLWISMPSRWYLPRILQDVKLSTLLLGIFIWPIILVINRGDPYHQYYREIS